MAKAKKLIEQSEDDKDDKIVIPEEHRKIVESLGWEPEEYWARMQVLEADGVTLEQLAEWRDVYGEVYRDSFVGKPFYYRTLTRPEHREHVMPQTLEYRQREEIVCKLCTLYPQNYDFENGPAGIPTRLMELILDHSGFVTDGPTLVF